MIKEKKIGILNFKGINRVFLAVIIMSLFFMLIPTNAGRLIAAENQPNRWEKEIQAFENSDKTNFPPKNCILFIGSSSIRMWKDLQKDFPKLPVINRGFGGSQIEDSTYFADRIVFPYEPKLIIMYAGGNDINAGKSAQRVVEDFKAFVSKVHSRLPAVKIGYISIAPNPARWKQIETVREANRLIKEFTLRDPRLFFIDTHSHMLGKDGQPLPDIFLDDKLHMNRKGYEIWKKIIQPYLN